MLHKATVQQQVFGNDCNCSEIQAAATLITMMMKKKHISSYERFFLVFQSIDLLYTNDDLMVLSYVPKLQLYQDNLH